VSRFTIIVAALVALAVSGCQDKPDTPAASQPASASPRQASPASTSAAALADDAVPTEEDFEQEAEKEISEANLEGELEKLEKEIGQ
jgi:hypothetical protein